LDDAELTRDARWQLDVDCVFGACRHLGEAGRAIGQLEQILVEALLSDEFVDRLLLGAEAEFKVAFVLRCYFDSDRNE